MLSDVLRMFAFQILAEIGQEYGRVIRENSSISPRLQSLLDGYWDLVYIYRYGPPLAPVPDPDGPLPGPSPISGSLFRDSLLLDVLDLAMGDPHPQPNSWIKVLGNKQIRINSAKRLRDHFKKAIPQLEAEAKRLEKLQ